MTALPSKAVLTGANTKNVDQKAAFGALIDFLSEAFGTDSTKSAVRAALGVPGLTDFVAQLASPGYLKLPGGWIIQWGQATCASNGTVVVTFPIAFPNGQLWNMASLLSTNVATTLIVGSDSGSATQMTIVAGNVNGQGVAANVKWLAIGRA